MGKFIPKITNFSIFAVQAHISRVRTVKFGVSVRNLDKLLALNFVKNRSGDLSLVGNFHQKFEF